MRRYGTRAAAAAAIALLLAGCGGGNKSTTTATQTAPVRATPKAATPDQLRSLARTVGHDIFWVGPRPGFTYELTQTKTGDIYIRYLPPGVPVGASGADFLSIGTYPQADAFASIGQALKKPGEVVTKLPGGGFAVASRQRPQSVYFAHPGSKLLVEVYNPSPAVARRLVTTQRVVPVR